MFSKKTTQIFLIIIAGALMIAGCDQIASQETPTPEPVQFENITPIVSATGVIIPAQFATLSMPTAGLVEEMLVEAGDQVTEGDVLVRLKGR